MHPFPTSRCILPLLALALCLPLTGCKMLGGGKTKAWTLKLTKATPATIEVDLVGVAPLDRASLESYPVDKYFSPNDPRRAGLQVGRDRLSKVLLSQNEPWIIDRKDEIWATWRSRGVTEVLVLARLPGKFDTGAADPRRLFIPLDPKKWDAKDQTIEIELQDTLIRPMTRQKR